MGVVLCDVGCTPQLISSVNLLIIVDFVVIVEQFLDFAVTLVLVEAEELIVIRMCYDLVRENGWNDRVKLRQRHRSNRKTINVSKTLRKSEKPFCR